MVLFLASDKAEWITGTAIPVDGGLNTGNTRIDFGSGSSGPSFERRERQHIRRTEPNLVILVSNANGDLRNRYLGLLPSRTTPVARVE
jgi:hypothetical protein